VGAIDGYELAAELGRGGSGVVSRARRRADGLEVALKVLTEPEGPNRETTLGRFAREARAALALEHPNIVRVLEVSLEEPPRFVAMELLRGGTLRERLRRQGALPAEEARALLAKLARAVHHAHERGFLHRDLKPENVLFDEEGEPKLVDFGLAKEIANAESLTRSGTLLGTPAYLAPEQARGEGASVASDVWGLGGLLYETLTGRPPFSGANLAELLEAITTSAPEPPRAPGGGSLGALGELAVRALATEPAARPRSALALALELEAGREAPRRRALAALLALSVLVVLGALTALRGRESPPAAAAKPAESAASVPTATSPLNASVASRTKAVKRDPEGAAEWLWRARARPQNDTKGKIADLTRALERDPECAVAWRSRGILKRVVGDHEGAFADMKKAIEHAPDDAEALATCAALEVHFRDFEAALAHATKAIEHAPDYANGWLVRARAEVQLGDARSAIADFEQFLVVVGPDDRRAESVQAEIDRLRASLGR